MSKINESSPIDKLRFCIVHGQVKFRQQLGELLKVKFVLIDDINGVASFAAPLKNVTLEELKNVVTVISNDLGVTSLRVISYPSYDIFISDLVMALNADKGIILIQVWNNVDNYCQHIDDYIANHPLQRHPLLPNQA